MKSPVWIRSEEYERAVSARERRRVRGAWERGLRNAACDEAGDPQPLQGSSRDERSVLQGAQGGHRRTPSGAGTFLGRRQQAYSHQYDVAPRLGPRRRRTGRCCFAVLAAVVRDNGAPVCHLCPHDVARGVRKENFHIPMADISGAIGGELA